MRPHKKEISLSLRIAGYRNDELYELPERCDHPEEWVSDIRFDIMDQPGRICKKCWTEFNGRDALGYLHRLHYKQKNRKVITGDRTDHQTSLALR